ncbi:sulfotransferase family protein [Alginatibacterium sediminis]|nr:sulfotransferase [Alginatibacterium sediminis]
MELTKGKAVIVVGMHRSGTSALSGEISQFGIFMGKSLFAAQKGVNDKGFFENSRIVYFNDFLFDKMLSSWDDPMGYLRCQDFDFLPYIEAGRNLLRSEYSDHSVWGIKDPRLTMLLPFWKQVFELEGVEVCFLHMYRNPTEVIGSLSKRDGFSEQKSSMLWLNYNLTSFLACHSGRYVAISFDHLLSDPQATRNRISEAFDLQLEGNQTSFIDSELRRNNAHLAELDCPMATLAMNCFRAIETQDLAQIEACREEYLAYLKSVPPWFNEHYLEVKKSEVRHRVEFETAYNTWTWKITSVIRKLELKLRGIQGYKNTP